MLPKADQKSYHQDPERNVPKKGKGNEVSYEKPQGAWRYSKTSPIPLNVPFMWHNPPPNTVNKGEAMSNEAFYNITRRIHNSFLKPYCWWFRNPANQLMLVVEIPSFPGVVYISGGWDWDFWTINSTGRTLVGDSIRRKVMGRNPPKKMGNPKKKNRQKRNGGKNATKWPI